MSAHRAYVGIGANIGDVLANVERAIGAMRELGCVTKRSSLYRTRPWGRQGQPEYVNAVVLLETSLTPVTLLHGLQSIERDLGRVRSDRWAPRTIDLDLLLYDDAAIDEAGLQVPHPRLRERAFVLVPLAEIDARYATMRDALDQAELDNVARIVTRMPSKHVTELVQRVEALVRFLDSGDATRVRVRRGEDEIEVVRRAEQALGVPVARGDASEDAPSLRTETIKADIVGIFHITRPTPVAGDVLDGDRELGYIEALGIRTPVRSIGAGRIVSVATADGMAVEYGQPLFIVARG